MEKIIINQLMYNCKDGTNTRIKELLYEAEKSPAMAHENGTVYQKYNEFLWAITDSKKGVYIENVYQTT